MRKGIDFIGVGVGAVIVNSEGKYFASQRGSGARNEVGKWEFPGGGVRFGDGLEETIIREMKEEHGIDIEVIRLLGVCDHRLPEENQHWVSPTYLCKIVSGTPTICEPLKCSAIGWFTLDELVELPFTVPTRQDIAALRERRD